MNKGVHHYMPGNPIAGYSGYVVYGVANSNICSYWMIPGTFFDDWDNQ